VLLLHVVKLCHAVHAASVLTSCAASSSSCVPQAVLTSEADVGTVTEGWLCAVAEHNPLQTLLCFC
jgi:hypothetical protein